MRITRYTDYSLRVLMYLALSGDELSTIKEISESYAISRNHLMKVVQQLNARGYIRSIRGKGGGLAIGRDPASINLGALIRDTERDLALVECFDPEGACVITPACHLKHVFGEALQAFFDVLDSYTLADLLPDTNAAELKKILQIRPSADRDRGQA